MELPSKITQKITKVTLKVNYTLIPLMPFFSSGENISIKLDLKM